MARPKRFELLTPWFVAKYSIQLSYGRLREPNYTAKRLTLEMLCGGERGIRTLDTGLSPYASLAGKCLRPLGQLSTRGRNDTRLRLKNQTKSGQSAALVLGLVQLKCFVQYTHCKFHVFLVDDDGDLDLGGGDHLDIDAFLS